MFDWGDGTFSEWLGPFPSGTPAEESHSWDEAGIYEVKVKAKDNYSESDWSSSHPINILEGPSLKIDVIRGGLFRVKIVIKNIGAVNTTEVNWRISLDGGAWIGKETTGKITSIPAGGEQAINSKFILGLGETRVTVTAEIPEGTATREQGGKIFLFYITVYPGGDI